MEVVSALNQIHPVSKSAEQAMASLIERHEYRRGQHLLNFWEIDQFVHFVVKGSGRVYYLRDGLDITDYFAMDGQFLGGVVSVFTGLPSHKAIELTEDSVIQSMKYADLQRLSAEMHEVETLLRKMMTWAFLECQERIESIRFLSAAERYHVLEKKYPGISNRIPLKHIASYLGTTQVSLSRIRGGNQ